MRVCMPYSRNKLLNMFSQDVSVDMYISRKRSCKKLKQNVRNSLRYIIPVFHLIKISKAKVHEIF